MPNAPLLRSKDYPTGFLSRYGRSLTRDELRLIQAYRGLPVSQREQLSRYASGLVVEHASEGRVAAARRETTEYNDAEMAADMASARAFARDVARVAAGSVRRNGGGAR